MSNRREQRLRRKARAAVRAAQLQVAQADELRPIALAAIRFIDERSQPNLKEPFSVSNRIDDLVCQVRAYKARRAIQPRRAA